MIHTYLDLYLIMNTCVLGQHAHAVNVRVFLMGRPNSLGKVILLSVRVTEKGYVLLLKSKVKHHEN